MRRFAIIVTVWALGLAGVLSSVAFAGSASAATMISGSFTALPTARVFDGTATTSPRQVQIAGLGGVPSTATAVMVNTEVFNPSAAGYVRVTPAGLDAGVAVQEFARGQAISNLVAVKLVGGRVQVKVSAGSARILMDVAGYYSTGVGASFTPLPTARVFDGTATTSPRQVQIASLGGVPANATAVVVNTEVFNPTAAGYVRVTPAGLNPGVATQQFARGQAISNLVAVKLVNGRVQVKVSAGSARILMDVAGYYGTGLGASFTPLPTARVFDGAANTNTRVVQIAGLAGVPANATAVLVNTEVFAPSAAGYVRVTPAGLDAGVATQEYARGQAISNLVAVKLVNGRVQVKVSAGSARILMDVAGYYSAGAPGTVSFGDGTNQIGAALPSGTYRTLANSSGCYWERVSGFSGQLSDIIANGLSDFHQVVTIAPTDAGFTSSGCGTWTSDLSTITTSPIAPFGDGMFIMGTDIGAGTWSAPGGAGCYWERLSGFSGEFSDLIVNDFGTTSPVVTIFGSDAGFTSDGCGTWTKQ